jgi:tRNA threonylcarbamoyladenosine biosynthesis protein TsaE
MSITLSEHISLPSAQATETLGALLADVIQPGWIVFLQGELGAGKTTLVRGLLRHLGYQGVVKSPTYTLLEPYHFDSFSVFHFDLYRIADADELEFIGFRDCLDQNNILLIEWPQRGAGVLPSPDIDLTLHYSEHGRHCTLQILTKRAEIEFSLHK